jgi:hypothetical protein
MRRSTFEIVTALVACLAAAGCGQRTEGGGQFGIDLLVSAALPPVSSFQVAFIKDGTRPSRACGSILTPTGTVSRCLNGQGFTSSDLAPLIDEQGRQRPAILIPANASVSDGGTQDVRLTAVEGTRYTLVIEALSTSTPPHLLGTSCTFLPQGIRVGDNGTKLADPLRANSDPCDPRWEK